MKRAEYSQLIDDLVDDRISEADFIRLEAEMQVNPEARTAYYDRLKLHTSLQDQLAGAGGGRGRAVSSRAFPKALAYATAIAAIVAVSGWVGWNIGREGEPTAPLSQEAQPEKEVIVSGYGVVTDATGDLFSDGISLQRGELVPAGPIQLSEGLAQIELFSGVALSLEGPGEFEVFSAMEMRLTAGRLRVDVPTPARGFRVRTASGDLVDLGTTFLIDVADDEAEVHVIDGEVEWHGASQPMIVLEKGEAVRSDAEGKISRLEGQGSINIEFDNRLQIYRQNRREAWLQSVEERKADDRLLAYFPMVGSGDWNRRLSDESGAGRDGAIVMAERVPDRWGVEGQALDFSPTGSRVRVNIPGEHRSLTFSCWVRIDSLDRWYNSLFLTDGHELHEPHWQIMDDGRLFFSVKRRDGKGDKHIAYSPPIWTPAMSGKWMHIATVYDGDAATTTHYMNGESVSVDQIPEDMQIEKARIGAACIGNWSEPMRDDPTFAVRNLNGAMDEFAVYAAALSADEIQEIYRIGKP